MPTIKRWCLLKEFNPLSHVQIKDYLKHESYKIPKDRQTKKPTSNEEALKDILSGQNPEDPVIPLTLDARGLSKGMGYLTGNTVRRDGKFHPFYTFRPDTGRLSAINPNIQNVPNAKSGVDKDIAEAIRGCIVPSKGKILMEFDWKAMEAVLTGYFASDPGYIRISQLDAHSFFASFILTEMKEIPEPADASWGDEKLIPFLEEIKERFPLIRYDAKRVNLATGYGMKYKHLAALLRCSREQAKFYLEVKDKMAPLVTKWKKDTMLQAHNEGRLETPFGYIRYFFEVLKKGNDGKWRPGKEANEALAFRPQSAGSSMLREALLFCTSMDGKMFDLLAPIHDALFLECFPRDCAKVVAFIKPFMERKWEELGGLSIAVDVAIGDTWGEMRHYEG
jgi:DNA polymerase I-like protein with 3'-5' exonuclease and polymerase domains